MKILTLEISDDIYVALQQSAKTQRKTIEEVAREWLSDHVTTSSSGPLSEAESQAAWDRLRSHAGVASLGYATGADNEGIDADVVREYGNPHENAEG
jgi:hypothetical protein